TVGAVLLHVVVALAVVLMLTRMKSDVPDRSSLPVVIAPITGYNSDGSPGSGPEPREQHASDDTIEPPPIPPQNLPLLPKVQRIIEEELPDPAGMVLPDHKLAELAEIDQKLARALARGDRTRGTGPSGVGPDGAVPQSFRWTLRFKTTNGRNYVYQLG